MSDPESLRECALKLLRKVVGDGADFRDGQWESIETLVARRARLLVVQRTGWGKSIVYFLATRLLRDQGAGPTLLVSPLLALMRNQIAAAEQIGIRAATINSTNHKDWENIKQQLLSNAVDILLISLERFANEDFNNEILMPVAQKTGLFVVDEAHCISDWGHDFRPDYRRILRIMQRLPANIPVCATTATANSRVVADIATQIGPKLEVIRGALGRPSLRLQTVSLPDDASKLAWLGHYLPKFDGSGIVYALTVRWTERIAQWLNDRGIDAVAYSAALTDEERQEREQQLLQNKVKSLVATTALGMGYDKPDLGFVVHFHRPGSVVHYYQQVGRAGRAITAAYGVMLSGGDDQEIIDYFIEEAFPPEEEVLSVLDALERSEKGLTISELQVAVNMSYIRIERVLKTLAVENRPALAQLERRWVRTPHRYDPVRRQRLVSHFTQIRREEQAQMDAYRRHQGCLMEFLARALDDPTAVSCGHCAICKGVPHALHEIPDSLKREAIAFIRGWLYSVEPRLQWQAGAFPIYGWRGRIPVEHRAEIGQALCIIGDPGWGQLVRRGKYEDMRFPDELVTALAGLVRKWRPNPAPAWVTCVPSLNHAHLVPKLAKRVATCLSLPFVPAVHKLRATSQQKDMQNSWHQAHNLDGAFRVEQWNGIAAPVLLVDDIVDSRWTFTVIASLLRQAGAAAVFPIALAANR